MLRPRPALKKSSESFETPWPVSVPTIPWKPHKGQIKAMKFLLANACGILALDPGLGKTSTVYGAFKVLRKKELASKMLVIAPLKPAYLAWPKEQEKWTDFSGLKVQVLHEKTRRDDLIADADVCVINPEGLDWLTGATRLKDSRGRVSVVVDPKRMKKFGFDTLVIDELTRFKHSNSGRFKVLKTVLHLFQRRWGLTGSLVANGLLDLFGQCYVIDQGRTFGQYITHYRNNYFLPDHSGFGWVIKDGAEDLIYRRLKPLVIRMAAEDYVDMPEVIDVVRTFALPPKVQTVYDQLEEDLITKIEKNVILAVNAAAASTKCRQVANGGIYLDPEIIDLLGSTVKKAKREWMNLHDEKTDLLENLVEELQGAPLLVAYDFNHDLDRLQARFGKDVPYIGGGVSAKRFKELEAAWNNGEIPLLFGHPLSVAHGLNLQKSGNHICWHSLTWDYEVYDQFVRRIRRQGADHKHVFVHHLIAKGTIDETMLWALRSKSTRQNELYDAIKNMRNRRSG